MVVSGNRLTAQKLHDGYNGSRYGGKRRETAYLYANDPLDKPGFQLSDVSGQLGLEVSQVSFRRVVL